MKRLITLFSVAVLVALATPAAADFIATGTFQYEDLPIDLNGFQSPHPTRPCRFVDVRVIDNATQQIQAQGATDANGFFSITVPATLVKDIAILALTQSANVSNLNYYVTQWNTTAVYAYQGILVPSHDPNTNLDMGAVTSHYRAGAEPFNLYDASFDASDCIGSMEGGVRPGSYRVRYTLDVSNDQAYYSSGIVNIGGNFGYDDTILLHETGHAMCAMYGAWTDSPAGTHYFEDNAQDPRLSWGEGWPTFFGSNVRDWAGYNHSEVYLNSTGDSTTGVISFSYSLETPPGGIGIGAASEVAVQACLWDLTDGDSTPDHTPGVDDEVGYQMDRTFPELWSFVRTYLSQPPYNATETYEDFHDMWLANAVDPQPVELGKVEDLNHGIQYRDDAFENDDSFGAPGMYYSFEDIGAGRTTHHTTWPAGDEDWIKFQGLAGCTYTIYTITMRDGADTYIEVENSAQTVLTYNDNVSAPSPNTYNGFEALRSWLTYTPTTTDDLWIRVRRSPVAPWGAISKYGNWNFYLKIGSVPATYPNILTTPSMSVADTLAQNMQGTANLSISNSGTSADLTFNLVEASGDIPWLSENPTSGTVPTGQARTVVLTFDATGLAVGTYLDTLEIHSNDPDKPVKYMPVRLKVDELNAVDGPVASTTTWLGASVPNPARPTASIRFSLGSAGPARLAIYDVQGREVRCLVDGARSAGEQAVEWNGRDQNGQSVASGVYFYTLASGGRTITHRLVMAR